MLKNFNLLLVAVPLFMMYAKVSCASTVYIDENGNVVEQVISVPATFETKQVTTTVQTQPVTVQRVYTNSCSNDCYSNCSDCYAPVYVYHHPRLYRPFKPYHPRYYRHHGWHHF